ncbi:MAG: dienelactone hydrolase family protein, partial [Hyphomicrobiaceae bacterium]
FAPVNGRAAPLDRATVGANDATTMDMTLADTQSLVSAAKKEEFGFAPAEFFAIGYCMGGRHALVATTRCSEVRAGISAHGGRLVDQTEQSPHLLVRDLTMPFHFYHARDDETCPTEHQKMITREAERAGPHIVSRTLDAYHGWSFPDRWSFDETASEHVWKQAIQLFRGAID